MLGRIAEMTVAVIAITLISAAILLSAMPEESGRDVTPQSLSLTVTPNAMACVHNVGNVLFCVTNYGQVGSAAGSAHDCETGLPAKSFEFPAGSEVGYLYTGGLWVGAIVGSDTLVSVGVDGWQILNELWPCEAPSCGIDKRSTNPASPYYHPDAISDLDMIAEYTDTLTDPAFVGMDWDGRPHIPLNIEMKQQSHSWSEPGDNEYVLVEYEIKALGVDPIQSAYIGMHADGDVFHAAQPEGYLDDVSGYRVIFPEALNGGAIEYAWTADNDGDPNEGGFDFTSATGVIGFAFLGPITSSDVHSFNWWHPNGNHSFDWAPWTQANSYFDFLTGGMGAPEGDRSKFFVLSNGETDYDQLESALDHTADGWLPPAPVSLPAASGCDTRFLLSFGPVDISPGEPVRFAVVFAGGHDFHVGPNDFGNLFDPYSPSAFQATLDFSSLEQNLTAARLMYDGIHTGDINWDGDVDIEDVIAMINYVFLGGDEPAYIPVSDLNCDGKRNLLDIIVLVNYIFRGGTLPGAGC
ncbi:MAG: dockerin type I repeat-containing protein [candidate division Zixibacteria bacterium]|nr:dockerin type I repeat-containing protein [candidate division Zixibacteria bacterium]MBU1469950.1 dockerin type I repeat-containing protein [candidate division Zixibacteria bacterium]